MRKFYVVKTDPEIAKTANFLRSKCQRIARNNRAAGFAEKDVASMAIIMKWGYNPKYFDVLWGIYRCLKSKDLLRNSVENRMFESLYKYMSEKGEIEKVA